MMKALVIACAVLGATGLAACEKAGEDMDSALEKIGDGKVDPRDGALEKTGEAVDNTLGIDRKNDADSIADAVDGDKNTKPN
ncbi:MAG: hypothetical protein KBF30_14400 [Hyphomonadaceae bacterium]|nr:hypothetical protein [Hyphomonadaceae bacterium]